MNKKSELLFKAINKLAMTSESGDKELVILQAALESALKNLGDNDKALIQIAQAVKVELDGDEEDISYADCTQEINTLNTLLAKTVKVTENTNVRKNQTISLTLAGVLEAVNDSYENGELNIGISKEQLGQPRGDGLAEFLHTEICEVTQGEDDQNIPQVVYNSICTAIGQLEKVKASLSNEPIISIV